MKFLSYYVPVVIGLFALACLPSLLRDLVLALRALRKSELRKDDQFTRPLWK